MSALRSSDLRLPQPYLLFLGDLTEAPYAKPAFCLRNWAPERCVGEYSLFGAAVTTGLPYLSPAQARARGALAMVIGVAPPGGVISTAWLPSLLEALEAGLDLISGMYARLEDFSVLRFAAEHYGRSLINVRVPRQEFSIATGRRRSGRRLLTVGTDCALGKKHTALALTRAFKERGLEADFRATDQTGILIAGTGVPVDAVVSDFVAGAAEVLSPDAADDHWDVVEGQGSLFHPSYGAVSLGLLHGTQPDVIVLCHDAGREHLLGQPQFSLPSLQEAICMNLQFARRTNPAVRCAGVSLNTSRLPEMEARALLAKERARLHLPVGDPVRGGDEFGALVEACLTS